MSNIFYNRLKKNIKKLDAWAKQANYQAYRIYDRDIPEYPYIVDRYENYYIVFEKGKKLTEEEISLRQRKIDDIRQAISELCQTSEEFILFKNRKIQKGLDQYSKLSDQTKKIIINEGNAKFLINLTDYLDTGLFLDHRPIRKKMQKISKGKKVLNLFSYTCSVSVHAAIGGGIVTSVDLSKTYINWGKENFVLNDIEPSKHYFIVADCIKFLQDCKDQFDIIFIDPPSFSNSKKFEGVFDVQRDHVKMLEHAKKLLSPNGIIIFSNNLRSFKINEDLKKIFQITDISKSTIPIDFNDPRIHHCFELKAI